MPNLIVQLADAPAELQDGIREFWPQEEWENAANISFLESGWNAFAVDDTTGPLTPCGTIIRHVNGVAISAERSVGYFQNDSCQWPDWEWQRLYNARHNCGTAHMLWAEGGWGRWLFSAQALGLI